MEAKNKELVLISKTFAQSEGDSLLRCNSEISLALKFLESFGSGVLTPSIPALLKTVEKSPEKESQLEHK